MIFSLFEYLKDHLSIIIESRYLLSISCFSWSYSFLMIFAVIFKFFNILIILPFFRYYFISFMSYKNGMYGPQCIGEWFLWVCGFKYPLKGLVWPCQYFVIQASYGDSEGSIRFKIQFLVSSIVSSDLKPLFCILTS